MYLIVSICKVQKCNITRILDIQIMVFVYAGLNNKGPDEYYGENDKARMCQNRFLICATIILSWIYNIKISEKLLSKKYYLINGNFQ